jgi:hypothetical protein
MERKAVIDSAQIRRARQNIFLRNCIRDQRPASGGVEAASVNQNVQQRKQVLTKEPLLPAAQQLTSGKFRQLRQIIPKTNGE